MSRIRHACIVAVVGLVAACSSETSDDQLNPQPLPPQDEASRSPSGTSGDPATGGGNFGNCSGTCCAKPAIGSTCDATSDTTCSWAVSCPSGLVIPYQITCTNGAWQLTTGCPAEGQSDSRGCPAKQPESGGPCTVGVSGTQCGYVLECTGYRKSAQASCTSTGWSTTPLGTCD